MGKVVEPKVFLIGESAVNREGLSALLQHYGVPGWQTDASSDAEALTEVYGRACYRSFVDTEHPAGVLNPNLTRVRSSSLDYLSNVIAKGDGSVLEHAVSHWFFADVSRVVTHELVRHRVGVAISQESLRFVRLTDLDWYAPVAIRENQEAMEIFVRTFEDLSKLQVTMAELLELDSLPFEKKKELTSAMRRVAPLGLATNIGWSSNIRNLRHVIEMRTAPEAEEEIRVLFGRVAEVAMARWRNLFADYRVEMVGGLPWYRTEHRKV